MHTWTLALLPLLTACSPEKESASQDTQESSSDTSETGDSADTGESAETAESGDTGETSHTGETAETEDSDSPVSWSSVDVQVLGASARMGLALTQLRVTKKGTEILDELVTVAFSEAEFSAEIPDATELDPLAKGLLGATFVPSLFSDIDADGRPDSSSLVLGAGPDLLLFLEGKLPADYAKAGFVLGWNVVSVDAAGVPLPHPKSPLQVQGPLNEIELRGHYNGAHDPIELSLALVPWIFWAGDTSLDPLVDEPLSLDKGAAANISLVGAPPMEHLAFSSDWEGMAGIEVPIAYIDRGETGYDSSDSIPYYFCLDTEQVGIVYIPGVTELLQAWELTRSGGTMGWNLATEVGRADHAWILEADLSRVEISGACPP